VNREHGVVPAPFAGAFAALASTAPEHLSTDRWRLFLDDSPAFLDQWGEQAAALGWTADDLFGLDSVAPLARYDRMGLLWMLKGERVVALTAAAARLSAGLSFYRRRHD
jgi:hypothetical protein